MRHLLTKKCFYLYMSYFDINSEQCDIGMRKVYIDAVIKMIHICVMKETLIKIHFRFGI